MYALFLAKWASRVHYSKTYIRRDWKVFHILPEKQEVWLIYGPNDFLHCVNSSDCTITYKRPYADSSVVQVLHPDEEKFLQDIPIDLNWQKPHDR